VLARIVALSAILALAWGVLAASASADGDPASDVLATQSLFLPQDASIPPRQEEELSALLQTAARSGYQIRVALVASSTDLGSVTELWDQPQNYARFLGVELSLVYRGPLLVVMPDGFGLYGLGSSTGAAQSALESVRARAARDGLGVLALTAVQRMAAASGHVLPTPTVTAQSTTGSGDSTAWIVFAAGGALIVLAWAASLRARPPRFGDRAARVGSQ